MTNFRPFCCNSKRMEVLFIKQIRFIKVRNLQNKKVEQKKGEQNGIG